MEGGVAGRIRYIPARSFIESLVYTLTYTNFEMRMRLGEDNIELLARELERHLCGLALAVPQLKRLYHDNVAKVLEEAELVKNIPRPRLGPQCPVADTILSWLRANRTHIYGMKELVDTASTERSLVRFAFEVVYQAVLGTLYSAGILSF